MLCSKLGKNQVKHLATYTPSIMGIDFFHIQYVSSAAAELAERCLFGEFLVFTSQLYFPFPCHLFFVSLHMEFNALDFPYALPALNPSL